MILGVQVGLGPGHIVLDGDPVPPPPKGQSPNTIFGPYLLWATGQMAGWIKMPLGMEVGLGPGHAVLDGDPAPPKNRRTAPHFSAHVYCGQTAGWIKNQDATWYEGIGLGSGHIVLHGDPASLHKGNSLSPNFRPISIVAKRSPISATAEYLTVKTALKTADL